jgi:hypothetical protein
MKPLAGTLVTPDNSPIANATVRMIATSNTTDGALRGTMFVFNTTATGTYAVNVLAGSYKVEFRNPNKTKYITLGDVTIAASDTTSEPLEDIGII